MFGRRRAVPVCAFFGVWLLISLYFLGRINVPSSFKKVLPNDALYLNKSVVNKLSDASNDFVQDEYKKVRFLILQIKEICSHFLLKLLLCPHTFSISLPKASIIICYFNESPSVLVRMVNSIIDRTPLELIQEILLVDDSSEWRWFYFISRIFLLCHFKNNLSLYLLLIIARVLNKHYLKTFPEASLAASSYKEKHLQWRMVKLIRTDKNEGLIRAKVFGAREARGEVLNKVVCPIIDIIDSDSMKYVESPVCKGGLNWALTFKWDYPHRSYFEDPHNFIHPLKSPTMAGGLFAVNRDYFFHLGAYDEGMDVWGAENVEISFRNTTYTFYSKD
uniref:Glyco_trans_2-like domain-containing protein n=1 Tax=Heterorhabditis bacteriophora TaxID=37862 RepID=A0A1I7XAI6_HETBA